MASLRYSPEQANNLRLPIVGLIFTGVTSLPLGLESSRTWVMSSSQGSPMLSDLKGVSITALCSPTKFSPLS